MVSQNTGMSAIVWGFVCALAAVFCNALFFAALPGQRAIVWISLMLAGVALVLVTLGIGRLFRATLTTRRRLLGSVLALVAVAAAGFSGFAYTAARLPQNPSAPQIGQRAPDFSLTSADGGSVALAQLLAQSAPSSSTPTKAVLLVFYRGWW